MCLWPWACRPSTGTYNIVRPENIRLNGIHFHVQSFWVRLCNIPKEILFTASSVKAYTYTENCRLLLRSCWAFVTHADGSRRTRVFIGVCLSVCLCRTMSQKPLQRGLPNLTKMFFHYESRKLILFGVKRSKVTRSPKTVPVYTLASAGFWSENGLHMLGIHYLNFICRSCDQATTN